MKRQVKTGKKVSENEQIRKQKFVVARRAKRNQKNVSLNPRRFEGPRGWFTWNVRSLLSRSHCTPLMGRV